MSKAGLWSWFLFESGLGTQRAKELLSLWETRAWSLQEALDRATTNPTQVGLTPAEGKRLTPPGLLPFVEAVPWDDARYPVGLNRLPIRLKPALLFYKGNPALMMHPMAYLAPADLASDNERDLLREIINLLIDENLLFAAYSRSEQARLVLDELTYGQGEALLFVDSGLETYQTSKQERALLAQERLLLLSPLAPQTSQRPALNAILQHVAIMAADRIILSGASADRPSEVTGLADTPTVAISETSEEDHLPPNVQQASAPGDVLTWLGLAPPLTGAEDNSSAQPQETADRPNASPTSPAQTTNEAYGLPQEDLGPPPSSEEILDTLKKGGKIPAILRERLGDRAN